MILFCVNNWTRVYLCHRQLIYALNPAVHNAYCHLTIWQKIYTRSDSEYTAVFVRIWRPAWMSEIINHLRAWRVAQVCRVLLLKSVSSEHLLGTMRNVAPWCPADCSVWRNVPECNLFPPLAGKRPPSYKEPVRAFSPACKPTSVPSGRPFCLSSALRDWNRSLSRNKGE